WLRGTTATETTSTSGRTVVRTTVTKPAQGNEALATALLLLGAALVFVGSTRGRLRLDTPQGSIGVSVAGVVHELASIRASAETFARENPSARPYTQEVERRVDRIAQQLPSQEALSDDDVEDLADRYGYLRETMPRGRERTIAMNRLVNAARVRAPA